MHRAVLISREDEIEPAAIHLGGMGQTAAMATSTPQHQNAQPPSSQNAAQGYAQYAQPSKAMGSPPLPTHQQQPPQYPAQQSGPAQSGDSGAAEPGGAMVGKTVAEVERELILQTLDHCLGNRTHAANILGISIRTLRNKLKQYNDEGIEVPAAGAGAGAE